MTCFPTSASGGGREGVFQQREQPGKKAPGGNESAFLEASVAQESEQRREEPWGELPVTQGFFLLGILRAF